jgi:hypothetical protein
MSFTVVPHIPNFTKIGQRVKNLNAPKIWAEAHTETHRRRVSQATIFIPLDRKLS